MERKIGMGRGQVEMPRRVPYFVLFLILAGCVSRFFWLGRESLWLDEAQSLDIARKVYSLHLEYGLFFSSWPNPHPFFYYFILNLWTKLFGTNEVALRTLSASLGVLLIVSTYHVGRHMISKQVGIIASILLLVNPVLLHYSQEVRMYTLTPLLILFSTYYFYRLLYSPKKMFFILYISTSTILLYTDYLGLLLLICQFIFSLWWFYSTRDRKTLRIVVFAYLAVFCLYIPWLPNALVRLNWGMITWMQPPSLLTGIDVTLSLLGLKSMYLNMEGLLSWLGAHPLISPISMMLYTCTTLIFILGLISSFREIKTFNTLVAMLCLVPLIIFCISVFIVPIFNLRQASVYLPEMALTMAAGLIAMTSYISKRLEKVSIREVRLYFMVPLLVVNLFGMDTVYTQDTKQNWREIAKDMEKLEQGKPIVLCYRAMVIPFQYYYHGPAQIIGIQPKNIPLLDDLVDSKEFILILSYVDSQSILDVLQRDFQIQTERRYRGAQVYFVQKKT